MALVNSPESSIARECDLVLPLHVGPEIGVASTKAFTGMLTVFSALAVKAAHDRGLIDAGTRAALTADLARLPGLMHKALSVEATIAAVSRKLAEARDILFLGRGQMYPMALEGALKLKEISYIHAEGYASRRSSSTGPLRWSIRRFRSSSWRRVTGFSTNRCRICKRSWPAKVGFC